MRVQACVDEYDSKRLISLPVSATPFADSGVLILEFYSINEHLLGKRGNSRNLAAHEFQDGIMNAMLHMRNAQGLPHPYAKTCAEPFRNSLYCTQSQKPPPTR